MVSILTSHHSGPLGGKMVVMYKKARDIQIRTQRSPLKTHKDTQDEEKIKLWKISLVFIPESGGITR